MIKNYTTEVSEERTVGEIVGLLSIKGARSIQIDYDDKSRPSGIQFMILFDGLPIPFKLPCDFEGVHRARAKNYKDSYSKGQFEKNNNAKEQSRRIAWRIIKDWIAAQMALIEAEQASLAQVFLPYAVVNTQNGVTAFEQFRADVNKQKALGTGAKQ